MSSNQPAGLIFTSSAKWKKTDMEECYEAYSHKFCLSQHHKFRCRERSCFLVWGIHKFQKTKLNPNGLSQLRDQLSCHLTCLCIWSADLSMKFGASTINDPKSLIFFFHYTFGRPGHHRWKTTTKYIGVKKETLYIYIYIYIYIY